MAFRLANVEGRAVLVDGSSYHDVARLSNGRLDADPMLVIAHVDELHGLQEQLADREPTGSLAEVELAAPVPRPRNVFAIGLNYADHIAESGMDEPEVPLVFTKFPSCIAAPNTDVELRSETADYEAEMVVVIGRGGRDIPGADAWAHVAGVTAGQDISDRALQFAASPPHFDLAKSRDGYGPIGPHVVSVDSFDDPDAIGITCDVNGERRQDGSTADLIFDVPHLVAYLSELITLAPGDLVFTGTPAGVGATTGAFLEPGDKITTSIEAVGTFTNTCS